MRIMTVDDNPMTGVILEAEIASLGHECSNAQSAAEALRRFEQDAPRVCILDWMMPEMDGLELACEIRRMRGGADAYIIMLTSKSDMEHVTEAYEAGVDDFIAKPVAAGELSARLRVAIRLIELQDQYRDRCEQVAKLRAQIESLTRDAAGADIGRSAA